ncbi:acylneuraminate cytidylyltransferase family protein [Alteromonas sp. 345S023]|uniref:Acylneuraminate cytidylyltransferase family protein n=1 Tax=Alteromonas profundi TaxID=2696062 RepID=A0A7X5LLR7_9ALTE|nr:acylneuraminate cytidylyltransferase family protein [Alteromonas profundi]NDV91700.1 acylneuraminate cytidylyltransferase family protein [Alteromonas profundi]
MTEKVTCFLPCRQGSQRVSRKNIKPFAGFSFGLVEVKLRQLLNTSNIDEVVLSTNDEDILAYANKIKNKRLRIHHRAGNLSSSETSTDSLVAHALELIPNGHILWTHVTSPFINAERYTEIINAYKKSLLEGYDSLMTTTKIHGFLWQNEKPINYSRELEKWPRTQTLTPIDEVNSGVFLASSDIYRKLDDRIGDRPRLYTLDRLTAHDIDWPEDFILAECIVREGLLPL